MQPRTKATRSFFATTKISTRKMPKKLKAKNFKARVKLGLAGYHGCGGIFINSLGRRGGRKSHHRTFWEWFSFDPLLCRKLERCNTNDGRKREFFTYIRRMKICQREIKLRKQKINRVVLLCLHFETQTHTHSHYPFGQNIRCFLNV